MPTVPLNFIFVVYYVYSIENMKFSLLTLVVAGILSTQMLTAQDTIKIKYEETFYMTPSGWHATQMASQMPKAENTEKYYLATEEKHFTSLTKKM